MSKKLAITFAVAAYVLPATLLIFFFSLEPIREYGEDLLGEHVPIDLLSEIAWMGMIGLSYLVALTALVLVAIQFPKNTRAHIASIGGLVFAVIISVIVVFAHLVDEFSGPWL